MIDFEDLDGETARPNLAEAARRAQDSLRAITHRTPENNVTTNTTGPATTMQLGHQAAATTADTSAPPPDRSRPHVTRVSG